MALKALFCAGLTSNTSPETLILPGTGVIAAAAASVLKPVPGTLSNGAASVFKAASYGVGVTFGTGSAPTSFIFARTSAVSGFGIGMTVTPIASGSDQPAASYGRSGGPPGYCRRSG